MITQGAVQRGRKSFARRAWGAAFAELTAADHDEPLVAEDLERLGMAAALIGKDEESDDIRTRAHHAYLRTGDSPGAARVAFWLAMALFNRGEHARGGGWMARAQRVLEESQQDCAERAYPLMAMALQSLEQGDVQGAHAAFEEAGNVGERFRDPNLLAMSRLGLGSALISGGQLAGGMSLLDEVMVMVTTEMVWPIVVGIVYCAVLDVCQSVFDVRRAQEWTATLDRWCRAQPDLVPFRGQCLVHRATLMQLQGSWTEGVAEAQRACEQLSLPSGHEAIGAAYYRRAELHRLLGEFAEAEEDYQRASERGASPHPGLALMRLAMGQAPAAEAAIRREAEEANDPPTRARLLPAKVEIMLAVGDVASPRTAAEEVAGLAAVLDAPMLRAASAHAMGSVLLAEADPRAALGSLRKSLAAWRDLEAPYEAARARVLIGLACRELADEGSARMDLEGARRTFQDLGAKPDLAVVEALLGPAAPATASGLTAREVEVLRLVAAGKTNRKIASELVISEKTVARHVSNIFTKLGLSSRAAATAYAYQHDLA